MCIRDRCIDDDRSEYRFRCPICETIVVNSTEARVIDLLVASGVGVDTWSLPRELFEPRPNIQLTHDYLLDFHIALEDDSNIAEALTEMD